MQRSVDRILTTHAGSLARPPELVAAIREKESGRHYDRESFDALARKAVTDVIHRQLDVGLDVIDDGEQAKPSFHGYFLERLSGFERKAGSGGQLNRRTASREYLAFKEYYDWAPGRESVGDLSAGTCTGPIKYTGLSVLENDLANIKQALSGRHCADVFYPCIAPSYVAATRANQYYNSYEEYEQALADAMAVEFKAIVDAGFIVQLDDPRIISYYTTTPDASIEDCRKWAQERIEVLNYSIRDLPPDKVRFHTCYSINIGPRV